MMLRTADAVMRHLRRQQLGPLPERRSWSSAIVLFFLFFNIFASTAFALFNTSSPASASASPTQTLPAPSRNRPAEAAPAPAPSDQHGDETPLSAAIPISSASPSTLVRIPLLAKLDKSDVDSVSFPFPLSPQSPSPPPPPYDPIVTPPPDQDAAMAKMGYSMTTFYSCDTIGGQEHCGWHVPVLKADGPTTRTDVRVVLTVVSFLAGILAWGLV
ncbi:hypothetical protein ACHAQJ_009286 [Trichoderma viride]